MKIGFILPGNFALTGPGNGVRAQAKFQAEALRRLGHEVVCMDPWQAYTGEAFDAVQFFIGGFAHYLIERQRPAAVRTLAFAPIIDSNEPNWRYRMAAQLGSMLRKVRSIPSLFRDQALGSDLVVCRSQFERQRVIRGLGVDTAKVEVVLNGVDPPGATDPAGIRARLNLPEEFVLHVSAYTQGRKNVVRLIEAAGPLGYPLVIAGTAEAGATLDRIRSLTDRYGNVTLLGFVDRVTLESLYAACKVFCLPSKHEGTGLVALEAAVHGAAVVITKNGGPPDYFLGHASYVDPEDAQSIRTGIESAWTKPKSDDLRHHLLTHLTWDESARKLVEAYARHARPPEQHAACV